ncbi:MAG: hypothetical protein LBM77_04965, partial [Spirochaetaceae bacterium]|nr:hypothetical protein [Spirochaetaceae bacterium]
MIGIDVYGLLERFAVKSQSPAIEVGIFVKALQSYAQRNEDELPEMDEWAAKPAELFRENIIPYEKQKKVKFFTDVRGMEQVFLPEIFVTMLSNDYAMVENDTSLPFPDEKKYEGVVPPEFLRQIDVYDELNVYFERPQSTNLPILKLVLHNSLSGIFVLAPDLPRRVLEIAIIKIRAFLRTHGNSEFYTHRLTASSEGRANLIKDMINQIESRPVECVTEIESGADNINIFWLNFCSSVRSQFELKTNFENEDVAVMQSIVIIEALCSYYKVNAVYQRNKTLGLQALESKLRHTPFYHTL